MYELSSVTRSGAITAYCALVCIAWIVAVAVVNLRLRSISFEVYKTSVPESRGVPNYCA